MTPLNILHVFRAPVGGLFRHVVDLAREQAARGHRVGLIADNSTGGERADAAFKALEPVLAHGISRIAMRRHIGLDDGLAVGHLTRRSTQAQADVVHGHGAKGGAYARLLFGNRRAVRVYTPHGGSLLFTHDNLAGRFYLATERLLMRRGDLFLFESAYSAEMFRSKIGTPRGLVRVAHNGVSRQEFEPVATRPDATDLVFMGELRHLKGIDVLLEAIARLRRDGRAVSATVVGSGPDRDMFHALADTLGLTDLIQFRPAMPGPEALTLGRVMVVPSRAESMPYVVLEAIAAALPLVATRVGGIPEIFGPRAGELVAPGDPDALAAALAALLADPARAARDAQARRDWLMPRFNIALMQDQVGALYDDILAGKAARRAARVGAVHADRRVG